MVCIESFSGMEIPEGPISPFQPKTIRNASQEVKMAENRRTAILAIQKVVEEEMDEFPQWPECEIANIFRKREGSESDTHRQVGKSGLRMSLL